MPESNNTSNNEPGESNPEDTTVRRPADSGDGVEPAHDGHADESETSGQHSPNTSTMVASTPDSAAGAGPGPGSYGVSDRSSDRNIDSMAGMALGESPPAVRTSRPPNAESAETVAPLSPPQV